MNDESKKLEEINLDENNKKEIESFKKRDCYNKIANFLKKSNGTSGRIICLHGLRRTGKTTLMRQLQLEFGGKAYEVKSGQSMENVFATLKEEHEKGTKLVFIDEITFADGFVDGSALLADLYASAGMDIVVAGTDSLGLRLARREQLYDRTFDIRTTLISFAEHNRVFGTISFDNEYKLYGGLMRKGLSDEEAVKDKESLNTFLDSAVAGNIAHTLSKAVDIDGYVELRRLREQYLDKNIINKFVPDLAKIVKKTVEKYSGRINEFIVNNKMTKLSIDAPFKDFLDKRKEEPEEFKDRLRQVDREKLKDEYRDRTDITNPAVTVTKELMEEVKEVLLDIDLIAPVPTRAFRLTGTNWEQTVGKSTEYYIVPPAIKFWLLEEAKDVYFENNQISDKDAEKLSAQLDSDISGKVTETTVLYQTLVSLCDPRYFVFKPRFNIDNKLDLEYDMLVWDKQNGCHWAFEIKHSNKIIDVTERAKEGEPRGQDSTLLREDITEKMTEEYGPKRRNIVLYNGNGAVTPNKTLFINIADFLINIDRTHDIEKTMSYFENKIEGKIVSQQKKEKKPARRSAEEFGEIFSGLLPDEKRVLYDFLKGVKDHLSDFTEPDALNESYNAAYNSKANILGAAWGDTEKRTKALDSVLGKLGIADPKFMETEFEDRRDAMLIMRDISRNLDGFISRKKEDGNRNKAEHDIDVEAELGKPAARKDPPSPTPPGSPSGGHGGRADD